MQEIFEKIIAQITELAEPDGNPYIDCADVIEIINRTAEEYSGVSNMPKNSTSSDGKDTNVPANDNYISRVEVIQLIEDIKENKDIPKNYGTLLDVLRQIRRLPNVQTNNDWIPCSERLPEEDERVLTVSKGGRMETAIYRYGGFWACGSEWLKRTVAWKPLPAPYIPKGE